jgi:hypothetical protein
MIFELAADHHKGRGKIFQGKTGFHLTKMFFEEILQQIGIADLDKKSGWVERRFGCFQNLVFNLHRDQTER